MQQLRICQAVKFFTEPMQKKYNLKPYTDRKLSTMFYGLYNDEDFKALYRHSLDVNKIHDDMNEYLKRGERL